MGLFFDATYDYHDRYNLRPHGVQVNSDGSRNTYDAWTACRLTGPRHNWSWPGPIYWCSSSSCRADSVPATFPALLGELAQTYPVPTLRRQHRDSFRGRAGTNRLWKSKHPGASV